MTVLVTSLVALSKNLILRRLKHTMRLVQFVEGGKQRVGVEMEDGGDIVDIGKGEPSIPLDMKSFLEEGEQVIKKAKRQVQRLAANNLFVNLRGDICYSKL